jgi:hypothetical protein
MVGAARNYADQHEGRWPTNFSSLGPLLADPQLLICPGDVTHHPLNLTTSTWQNLTSSQVTYVADFGISSNPVSKALYRCPIHGNVARGDGSVQQGHLP